MQIVFQLQNTNYFLNKVQNALNVF